MDLRGLGLSDDDLRQLGYDIKQKAGSGSRSGRGGTGSRGEGPAAGRGSGGARERPPAKRWAPDTRTWLTSVLVLTAVGWASGSGRWLPAPSPVAAPDTSFSSGRAVAQLVDVARGPRPTGSPANERARTYLLGRLRSLGLEAEVQTATAFVRDSGMVRSATVHNVVARLPGTGPSGALLLTAHYDTKPQSPGVADGGAGVATVLEVVRALRAGPQLRNDVVVLLADGEELGNLGARAFAKTEPGLSDVALVLSVEARGASGPAIWFEGGPSNGGLVETIAAVERRPSALSLARSVRSIALESARIDELLVDGPPVAALSTLGNAAFQHQRRDDATRVSEASLQHAGRQLLAVTRTLGMADLQTELTRADRVYLSLPRVGAVHYPRGWVLLTTLVLFAIWGLAALVLRGRRATRLGVGIGLAAGAAAVAASAVAARGLRELATEWHPEFGTLTTAFYEDGPYVLASLALAVACGGTIYAVAKRWARSDELVFGGLCLPLLYASWLTFVDPFAAAALQLPLAAALLGGALVIVLGPNRARTTWAWSALLSLSAVALVLAVPSAELLASVWTFGEPTRIGAVLGLGLLLLWPLMERLLRPRAWWTPLAAFGAAAALVAPTLPSVRDVNAHPVPTTLVYFTDEPVLAPNAPRLAGLEPAGERTRSMAGKWLTVPGPGEAWSRSWAGEPATGSTDPGVLLIGEDARYEVIGTAPVSELVAPRVEVTGLRMEGGSRRVELSVRSGLAGEMVGIHIPGGVPASIVGVEDVTWGNGAGPVRSVVHWGAPKTSSLRVHVQVAPDEAELPLVVLEHHLRPRELLGSYFFQRPDSLVPNGATGSDRAIQRTRLSVRLDVTVAPRPVEGQALDLRAALDGPDDVAPVGGQ